jgi:hypothetical protein
MSAPRHPGRQPLHLSGQPPLHKRRDDRHLKRVSEWAELFGEEVLAAAILYRLLHKAEVLTINNSSYRLRGRMEMITREGGDAEAGADN